MRSSALLQTLEGWPSQIGVPMSRISAFSIFSRMAGQASPSPSSELTPRLDIVIGEPDRLGLDILAGEFP